MATERMKSKSFIPIYTVDAFSNKPFRGNQIQRLYTCYPEEWWVLIFDSISLNISMTPSLFQNQCDNFSAVLNSFEFPNVYWTVVNHDFSLEEKYYQFIYTNACILLASEDKQSR